MNRHVKRVRESVEALRSEIAEHGCTPGLAAEFANLDAAVSRLEPRKRQRKDLAPGKSIEERRADHRASTGDLRAEVFARSRHGCSCNGGHCEACSVDLGTSWDMHHVENGGDRRPKQRLGNLLALCWGCHRLAHRGDLDTLRKIAAAPTLDAEAKRAAERRVAKVEEARAQHPTRAA